MQSPNRFLNLIKFHRSSVEFTLSFKVGYHFQLVMNLLIYYSQNSLDGMSILCGKEHVGLLSNLQHL